jgi:putative endopeptidase
MNQLKLTAIALLIASSAHANPNENWVDTSYSPADNFYQFANQPWIDGHPIPQNESEWGVFNVLGRQIDIQMHDMLMKLPSQTKLYQQQINQQLYLFFKSGMDTKTIEKENIKPIQAYLDAIQAIDNPQKLFSEIARIHQLGIAPFFSFGSFPSFHQKKFTVSQLSQPGLILPDRNYYLMKDEKNQKVLKAYQTFITKLFLNLGYSQSMANQAYKDVLAIETKLATISEEMAFFRSPKNIDHMTSIQTIRQNYPNLDFQSYFKTIGFENLDQTNLQPDYFSKLNQYLPNVSYASLRHYLTAYLMVNLASSLSESYSHSYCEFNKAIRGNKTCPERWLDVLDQENQLLGFALGDLYVANYYQPGEIDYIQKMLVSIKDSLKQKIEHSSWLSPKTQEKALEKLALMSSRIGFPKPLDYSKLNIHSKIYVENTLEAARWYIQHDWGKINKPINPDEWSMSPQSVNAYYDVTQNQINIPLGILQAPFFSMNAPAAFNYGGIGVVMGHELFHGFDDEGSQFDGEGIFHKWWTESEWNEYQKRVNCIVEQFSSYPIPKTNIKVKGNLVSGEAIADLGGVTLSLDAFIHSNAYQQAKDYNHYSPIQQFFIRFAQIWAANQMPEEAKRRGLIDPHPPEIYRVNGTLANVPLFYKTFNIKQPDNLCTIF